MFEVRQSAEFVRWLSGLRDREAQLRISTRLRRMESGNPGDCKSVGSGVHEMRLGYGPGYRLYFTYRGDVLVILLCGGDKSSQAADIARAKAMAREV